MSEELLASSKKKIDKFVPWTQFPDKGRFDVYKTRDGVCLLNRKTGRYTFKGAVSGGVSVHGVVGNEYSMSAVDACHCLVSLEVLTADEAKAFTDWFWKESRKGDRKSKLLQIQQLAKEAGGVDCFAVVNGEHVPLSDVLG